MFARVKKSGKHQYLQIVENRKIKGKVIQRVIATIGRMDRLQEKDRVETLIRSLSRFSEKALLILSGKSDVSAASKKIGPGLIFERLWEELGIKKVIKDLLYHRKFEFDVERAIFLTVLHRLFVSGSDRSCEKWHRDYKIRGVEGLSLHHLYRTMAFLGEQTDDQTDATPFSPRCSKDLIEESIFLQRRDLFTGLDLVFFDTTSIYFEGEGGQSIGQKGHSKDHRPDLNQMVVGAVIDNKGKPVCCEMWPGNTADVKTLIPVIDRVRSRFNTGQFCIVADRGMISAENVKELDQRRISYIFGARMRKVRSVLKGPCPKILLPSKSKRWSLTVNDTSFVSIPNRPEKMPKTARPSSTLCKRRLNQIPKVSSAIKGIENTSRSRRTASGLIKTRSRGNPDLMANGC
jgi:hypothetical protein